MPRARRPWRSEPQSQLHDARGMLGFRESVLTKPTSISVAGPALVFVLDRGVASVKVAGQRRLLDRSNWLLVPQREKVDLSPMGTLIKVVAFFVAPSLLRQVAKDYAGALHPRDLNQVFTEFRQMPRTVWVDEVAQRYLFERSVCGHNDNFVTYFCENELIKEAYFLCRSARKREHRGSVVEHETQAVERATAWLEEHLFSNWTSAQLAKLVGLSPRSLQRAFNLTHGVPPAVYARERKLDNARLMLKSGASTVKEVARRVGYSSTAAFSHAFQARFGQSPSQVLGEVRK